MYDHPSLFEEADTEEKTITDAIKIAFGIDYKPVKAKEDGNGSNGVGAVGVDDNGGPSGERGGGNDAKGGELLPEGDGNADGGRGNQGNGSEGTGSGVGSDGKTDNQGNPLNADGTLKLEKITSIDELRDEDFSAPTRNVELPALPRNVDEVLKTDDIHPPKTGISVHFSCSLP